MKAIDGWERKSFKELGVCIRGVSYKPDDLRPAPNKNNVTLLRSNNIRDGRLNYHNLQFVAQSVVRDHQRMQNEDIAICMSNGNRALVGKSGQFVECGDGYEYTVGAFCSIFRPCDEFDASFIRYLFGSDKYQRQLDGILAGSAINNLKGSDIDGLISRVPTSKPEQTKIAEILSTVDRTIEQTEALIAKQQRIKTGLMHDLLTRGIDEHGNLRSEQTHKFKDSPLGRIPVEWEVVHLGNVSEISSGVTLGKSHSGPSTVELPYLRVANVQDGYFDLTEVKVIRIPKSDVERYQLNVGDVLMNEGGDFDKLGRGSVWNGEIEHCLHQNHVFKVRPKSGKLASDYLAAVSSSPYGKSFFVLASKQSTNLASINSTQLKSFPIPLSEYDEQLRIEIMVKQNVDAYNETIRQLHKLRSLKTALMQDLLTGKKRVTPLLNDTEVIS